MAARYKKLRKIADGGMAEIFLAIQHGAEGFERRVVLKQILAPLLADPKFKNMIIDEAHVAMSLHHSNIVQVLDLGQWKGRYFLVLELVDGWDLNQIVNRVKQSKFALPPEVSLYLIAEICRALSYAHSQTRGGKPMGIVHRDVSPHNVLVSEQGEVKLTDFGIAKAATGRRERTGQGIIKGKLAFMSPEQASGAELDARSDLFSVGTMLYLFFTGRRPFESPTDLETVLRVQQCQFPPALQIKPDLPPEVVKIIDKAMRKDPADRYQTGEEMLMDLEAAQRSVYRPAGQTELRRWLMDLAKQDHAMPVSRAEPTSVEPPEMELDLDEDIIFEQSVGGETLPPIPGQRGGSASSVLRAAESLRAGGLTLGEAETQAQAQAQALAQAREGTGSGSQPGWNAGAASGSAVLGAPSPGGRRRWLVAGVVAGAAAASGVLGVIRMREASLEPRPPGEGLPPSPSPPVPASPSAAPADPGPTGGSPPAAASPPMAADAAPSLTAGRDAAGDDGALARADDDDAGAEEDDEDEEVLLQQQEPDIASKVIGEETGTAATTAPAPGATARTTKKPAAPARPAPAEPASVRIESAPTGAVVKLGSRVLGRAPLGLRFNPGITYELAFVKSGYHTTRKRFTASGRKGQTVSARLKKRPTPPKRKNFFQRLFGR